jgi:hypothetical protein
MHDVAEQRRRRLVPVGREIEVDIARPHLGVIAPRRAARHEAVAEVDEAAEGDIGQQDRLLEADRVSGAGLFLQQRPLAHMRPGPERGAFEENGFRGIPGRDRGPRAEPDVVDRHRTFGPERDAGRDDRLGSRDAATGVNDHAVAAHPGGVHVVGNVDGVRQGHPHPCGEQSGNPRVRAHDQPVCRPLTDHSGPVA